MCISWLCPFKLKAFMQKRRILLFGPILIFFILGRFSPHIEPLSWHDKLESGPFSTLFTCTNKAAVGDKRNYNMNNKMCYLFEQLHEAENAMLWWLCFFYFLFNKRSPEDVFGKDSFSAYIISWKHLAKFRLMIFMSKQVCQKWYTPF